MDIELSKRSFNLALNDANKKFEDLTTEHNVIESFTLVQSILAEITDLKKFFDKAVRSRNELCIDSCLTNLTELLRRFDIAITKCYNES